jgi:phospholipid/cholesterol/gamma-HCH transport system substrate-binding protein
MLKNIFETIIGGIVLFVAFSFVMIAYKSGSVEKGNNGYFLTAKFDKVDGLNVGSDVKMSGIKIGKIVEQKFDPETFRAVVKLTVNEGVKVPSDSSADIIGDGLLGSKYLSISPGGEDAMLTNNGEIEITQSSVSFEQLIGKFIHGGSDDKPTAKPDAAAPSGNPASLFTEPLSSSTAAPTPSVADYNESEDKSEPEAKKPTEVAKPEKKDTKKKN